VIRCEEPGNSDSKVTGSGQGDPFDFCKGKGFFSVPQRPDLLKCLSYLSYNDFQGQSFSRESGRNVKAATYLHILQS